MGSRISDVFLSLEDHYSQDHQAIHQLSVQNLMLGNKIEGLERMCSDVLGSLRNERVDDHLLQALLAQV